MTRARTNADQAHTESVESIPHIIPGVLYPAVAGKLLDGSTSHGATYGVAQSDGRSYYYTDIKGSKPIKDPRIGAHFGSQRYLLSSAQLQPDETAMQGFNVYRFEGREWVRGSGSFGINNDSNGIQYEMTVNTTFIEITGYFSDANIQAFQYSSVRHFTWSVDGGSSTTNTAFRTSTNIGPNGSRYVNGAGWQNIGLGATLGIHTLKILNKDSGTTAQDFRPYAFELIAQDTSSTANKSKIQIPSQNVVSYGKKFTVSGTPHYDPFNGFTSGNLAAVQALIDTDTSLGMANWLSSSTYYRPFNGGRVVKWVDSSGNIKTSVTMMPPNAQNIGTTASNPIDLSSSQTNDDTINFNTSAIDHSLSEVAKTFHWREFGNGAANGGTGATYADASMLNTIDDIAYVMDDGLTSFSAKDVTQKVNTSAQPIGVGMDGTSGDFMYLTFIGTGISNKGDTYGTGWTTIAQNLPYGTHILKIERDADSDPDYTIDGISLADVDNNTYGTFDETSFHQPKKPPIPEDAVVLADYMLMADYVQNTSATTSAISKGVRRNGGTRDHFYDCGGAIDAINGTVLGAPFMFVGPGSHSSNAMPVTLPYFGTSFTDYANNKDNSHSFTLDGSSVTPTGVDTDIVGGDMFYHAVSTLGLHVKVHTVPAGGDRFQGTDIATPIHTSSHYQSFETPYLHELVGGDRNMEQTNLVVTADGKTWDEVTRDTSYLGNTELLMNDDEDDWNSGQDWKIARGVDDNVASIQKDFAIAYDRFICLVGGNFSITYHGMIKDDGDHYKILKNGGEVSQSRTTHTSNTHGTSFCHVTLTLVRGDYIQTSGQRFLGNNWGRLTIERV